MKHDVRPASGKKGQFWLQFAVEDEDLAVALPAAAVVNVVGRRCA